MTDDPIRRKKRWEAFYQEEGGLRDILAALRAEYFARMSDLEPWQLAKLANLAIAAKITGLLESAVLAIIAEGVVAEKTKAKIDQIEAVPDYKRRWAQGS